MATLEIHDGKGRVEYLTISPSQQVLIGSDPKCDIVIQDREAMPFHGRLRWKNDRYKVEATPEASTVEVDGKRVVSSSFRQGSELRIGKARIFLITPDDGPAQFEKTRVQARPGAPVAGGWAGQMGPMAGEVEPPSLESALDDVEEILEQPAPPPRRRGRASSSPAAASTPSARERGSAAAPPESNRGKPHPLLMLPARWVRSVLTGKDQAPGEERVLSSPVVIILVLTLAILVSLGFGLFGIIREMAADRAFAKARESLENAEYRNAIERFDLYVENYPRHSLVSEARVLSALAQVRQFTTGSNPAWANALDAAGAMFEDLREEPAYPDARADLAGAVLDVTNGLVDRAQRFADGQSLELAEDAVTLHDRIGGSAAMLARERADVPTRLEEARASVLKNEARKTALGAMDAALDAGDPDATYEARDVLVTQYADQADDPEVITRLRSANELIRAETSVDLSRVRASAEPRPDPLGPPTSLVLRSTMEPATENPSLAYAVADGFAYALDASNGAPVWHVPVGLDCPFPPIPIPGARGDVLVFDSRHEDLLRLAGQDGRLVWRQELGEAVVDPPLILGNQLAQPTAAGRLVLINLVNGERQASIDLGRPLAKTPVADDLGRHYYVLGEAAVAFVVRRDPVECVAVEYVGHDLGFAAASPARIGNYLLVAENRRPESGRWSLFQIEAEGTRLRLRQRVDHVGWTWDTPASSGQVLWAVSDRGSIDVYAIGPYEQENPLRLITRIEPEGTRLGPTFTYARTDRELWVASARSARYDLDPQRATLATAWTLSQAGAALAAPQIRDDRMILTQAPERGRGAALWSVDPRNGSVAWRTILGSPWPSPPEPMLDRRGLASLSGDGSRLLIPVDDLQDGGFVVEPIPRPGDRRLPVGQLRRIDAGSATLIIPAPDTDHLFVRQDDGATLSRVTLPSPLSARPLIWEDDLLVPGVDGRVYLIDPTTGGPKADPLLPTFTGDGPIAWLDPVPIDSDAIALADRSGVVRRVIKDDGERPRLMIENEVALGQPLVAPPGSTGDTIFLATADGWIRALASRDLSPSGAWELDAPVALGPFTDLDSGTVLVADASGKVIAFGVGGERLWTIDLEGDTLSGPPIIEGEDVWLSTLGGTLHRRARGDGASREQLDLTPLPAGGPSPVERTMVLPSSPGTLRMLRDPTLDPVSE
ncbi:PQQ-binding-like beta-propeller repeat protein [Tautonia sp. JC769]|uniref:outer membrane protein assembly factor BamB family protein n=1 Tax=Tautonia sp. JC769 TaxID=3232135 RepID=UPI0034597B0C